MALLINITSILLIFILAIITQPQQSTHSQLTITKLTAIPTSSCKINIFNTHQILDIQTNCNNQAKSQKYQSLIELINLKSSYLIKIDNDIFQGYRYFKMPNHYKLAQYNFSLYHNALDGLLKQHGINFSLQFQDRYQITAYYDVEKDSWIIQQIVIKYIFNPITEILELPAYKISYTLKKNTQANIKDFFLTRRLTGKGLHQSINITLHLDLLTQQLIQSNTCYLSLEEVLPESTYIDYDQLRTVNKYETIDIEKPQYYSKQYFYQYMINLNKFTRNQLRTYSYSYPIHFRYPKPSELNYTIVALHPADQMSIICNNGTNIITFQQQLFTNRGVASIFTGSNRDNRMVSIITFVLMIIASMVIIKKLKKE